MQRPSPYDYLNYRSFLSQWFAYKKSSNPRFSYRLFARLAGQKSSSLLHHVINGERNLTPATLEGVVQALKLRAGEAQFFRLLVELDQAADEAARNAAWEKISTTRRFREARPIERAAVEYLSNWSLPAIRELASRADFRPDPVWVGQALRPPISPAAAEQALHTLLELGFLVQEGESLVPAEASLATPAEVQGMAYRNYHRVMLERASASIDAFAPEERHLLAVTVGVPASLMPTLKAESTAFMQRLMHLCDASEQDADQVLQLNLQIFPLSDTREDP